MALVRWDPFRNVATLQDRINRLFEDAFPRARDLDDDGSLCAWRPAVDIYETAEEIIVLMEKESGRMTMKSARKTTTAGKDASEVFSDRLTSNKVFSLKK